MSETVQPQQIQEPVSVDDNSSSLTVDNAGLTELAAAIDTELQVDVVGALPAGNNNIGDVDVASVTGNVTVVQGTAANLNVTEASGAAAAASLSVIDDWDESDRAKVNPIVGQTGVQGASGTVSANTQRVVLATDVALPAGTNAIGKLSANSGVDIGDVDVTSVPAPLSTTGGGTEATALRVTVATDSTGVLSVDDNGSSLTVDNGGTFVVQNRPETANGLSIFRSLDIDETEEAVKGSAGQVYGWAVTNTATTTRWIKFYDDTTANVTVGSTTPVITWGIPGNTSDDVAANMMGAHGIAFANAITVAATTGVADADTGAPSANDVIINVFYK